MIIKDDQEAYQQLKSQQAEIEEEMGESLIWRSPEEAQRNSNRAKITLRRPVSSLRKHPGMSTTSG